MFLSTPVPPCRNGQTYAVKTIPKVPRSRKCTSKYLKKLQNEVDCMRQLGASLSAVFLQDIFEDDANIYMVMELCEGTGKLDNVVGGGVRSERAVKAIIKQVLQFLAQCHAKGVIYRDVKPDNFLFLSDEPDAPIKATDFGLAIRFKRGDPKITTRSGTPVYMAPEVVTQSYDERADVWSAGMLMYQVTLTLNLTLNLYIYISFSYDILVEPSPDISLTLSPLHPIPISIPSCSRGGGLFGRIWGLSRSATCSRASRRTHLISRKSWWGGCPRRLWTCWSIYS